jgi:hypothetical protein
VTLSAAQAVNVYFDATSANGTATAGSDYVAKPRTTHRLLPGETSKTFTITINGDTTSEPDETFLVNLTNPVGGVTIADAQAIGTITNDDAGVRCRRCRSPTSASAEGNAGSSMMNFVITLSGSSPNPTSFDIATSNGTATAGSDYSATSMHFTIPVSTAGDYLFPVPILGDTQLEGNETFSITLSNPAGATIADGSAAGTITNDDVAAPPSLSIGDVTISEGNSGTQLATFTVTLSAAQAVNVYFDATSANGTATAGSDYVAKPRTTHRLLPGETSKTFTITINGDTTSEPDETFLVNLTNPVGGVTIADAQAIGTISNDDAAPAPTLSVGDVSISEGNSGTKLATFTVSLSAASASAVTFDIGTANGTATAVRTTWPRAWSGQSIARGQTSKTFSVTINGDTTVEPDETFTVNASNVSGATIADWPGGGHDHQRRHRQRSDPVDR